MRNIRYKNVSPYIWLALGLGILCGLFMLIYTTALSKSTLSNQVNAADSLDLNAKVFTAASSYRVVEEYREKNSLLPQYSFGGLQVTKNKLNRGMQVIVKKGHVIDSYTTPNGQRGIYIVQRVEKQESSTWTQIDMVTIAPDTQQIIQEPIGYTYGEAADRYTQSTLLCGFISEDEFLYTTVANVDQEWVYLVNKFNISQKTVTPMMELFRYESLSASPNLQPPVLFNAVLTPDKKQLLVRDSINGIVSYNMSSGSKKRIIPGSNERREGELFQLVGDSGLGLYSANRFQSDTWMFDLLAGSARQPFTAEPGFIDLGLDAKGKVMYYNFTYDRAPEQWLAGENQTLLLSYGVQLLDLQGNALKRFSLPKDSKERLEFGGYSESKKIVLLHKYTMASNSNGQAYKKTSGWLLGNMDTGAMTPLNRIDVPDSWEKTDMLLGKVTLGPYSPAMEEQAFVNNMDNTYYMCRWKTKQVVQNQDEDMIVYADEQSKRVFVSSFTRPDLVVAALNYKKYNWDNQAFRWLNGHWMSRYTAQPDGDKIYLFQIN